MNGYSIRTLAYSEVADGALCKFCVLFKQKVHRGFQSFFILKRYKKYKDFNEATRNHIQSEWHKQAISDEINLMTIKENKKQSIFNVISQSRADLIAKNVKS